MHFSSNTRLYYIEIQHLSVFQQALLNVFEIPKKFGITVHSKESRNYCKWPVWQQNV